MFDWYDYLEFADDLFGENKLRGGRECMLRNAISRAYYGAYCTCIDFFRQKQVFYPTGKPTDHLDLITACKTHGNWDVKEVGKDLEWLRNRRNTCDYDAILKTHFIKDIEDSAEEALERAFELVDTTIPELARKI